MIVITSNYDCHMFYRKGAKRRLDLHMIELESYVGQINKGYGYERHKKYIKHNAGDLNAAILHFKVGVQSDSE